MPDVVYSLLLDGHPAPPDVLGSVLRIEVEDHARMADMLRLRLALRLRDDDGGWSIVDDGLFPRLGSVEVRVQVGSRSPETLIQAHVIETTCRFSATPGESSLDVVAMDPTVLLDLEERVRAWPNMSDSDIATTLFGEHGFASEVDDTPVRPDEQEVTTLQRGTDMRFLQHLARRNGFEVFVEYDPAARRSTGHFHRPRLDPPPQGTLSLGLGSETNLEAFEVRNDLLRPASATGRTLAAGDHQAQDGEASDSRLPSLGEGGPPSAPADRPRRVLLSQTGASSAAELQAYAQAVVDEASFSLQARGEVKTVAYGGLLRAKRPVLVRGVGRQLSGTYYVEKVLHTFSGESYTQKFQLRRNAAGLRGNEDFTTAPQSSS